ncbi:hypothetical protein ACFFKU_00310 [Kineococcus gynurae]|uniref:CARDB protein n=1 Tax=Kineococcus gynurae TaxID=452979 RepID=A0ABV5LXL0_9ACTN
MHRTGRAVLALVAFVVLSSLTTGTAGAATTPAWKDRRADLRVVQVGWVPVSGPTLLGQPLTGSRVRLYATITNTGDRPTPTDVAMVVEFSGVNAPLDLAPVVGTRSLAPGNTRTVYASTPTVVPAENLWFDAVVNRDGRIPERELADNSGDGDLLGIDPTLITSVAVGAPGVAPQVRSTVGASPLASTVTTTLSGERTWACVGSDGTPRAGTTAPGGRFSTTTTVAARDSWFRETHAAGVPATALRRSLSAVPAGAAPCPRGTTPAWVDWRIDTVDAVRTDRATATLVSRDQRSVDVLYRY